MPRISKKMTRAVVYLYGSEQDAHEGRQTGGSGFLVSVGPMGTPAGALTTYVVTNVHVVHKASMGPGAPTVRLNRLSGGVEVLTIPGTSWTQLSGDDDRIIGGSFSALAQFDPGLGDEVVMLGRFSGHSGLEQNDPVARFGNVARMSGGEPVLDGRGILVDAFLVDMRSQAGYSGSQVFLVLEPHRANGTVAGGQYLGFLGIDTGHKMITAPLRDKRKDEDDKHYYVKTNSGIAVVAPYYKIMELLNLPELVERREQRHREWIEHDGPEAAASD